MLYYSTSVLTANHSVELIKLLRGMLQLPMLRISLVTSSLQTFYFASFAADHPKLYAQEVNWTWTENLPVSAPNTLKACPHWTRIQCALNPDPLNAHSIHIDRVHTVK